MAATLDAFDREDAYDETDLLLCIQDMGRWEIKQTTRVEDYKPSMDWYACCRELQRHLKDQDRIFQPVFLRLGRWYAILPLYPPRLQDLRSAHAGRGAPLGAGTW